MYQYDFPKLHAFNGAGQERENLFKDHTYFETLAYLIHSWVTSVCDPWLNYLDAWEQVLN